MSADDLYMVHADAGRGIVGSRDAICIPVSVTGNKNGIVASNPYERAR